MFRPSVRFHREVYQCTLKYRNLAMGITLGETIISLAAAPDDLPRRRSGRPIHVSCIYRWTTVGCRGVVLESLQVGGTRCTSREALQRFFDKLSEPARYRALSDPGPGPIVGHRTPAQRQR
jgi:hypothetical protein